MRLSGSSLVAFISGFMALTKNVHCVHMTAVLF